MIENQGKSTKAMRKEKVIKEGAKVVMMRENHNSIKKGNLTDIMIKGRVLKMERGNLTEGRNIVKIERGNSIVREGEIGTNREVRIKKGDK